jgi:hypothetical protein
VASSAIRQIARLGATGAVLDEASNNMVERTGPKRPAAHHDRSATRLRPMKESALEYDAAVFSRQYPVVVFFVQHIAYYRGLHAKFGGTNLYRHFWRSTCDAHLKLATIAWCNIFGSNKEDLHWTRTPSTKVAAQATQDIPHWPHFGSMADLSQGHARFPQ